jgi:carbon-monoxide dehydrogenase small subunit
MRIQLVINDEKVTVEADPEEGLLSVLRRRGLVTVKEGCGSGTCGACTVLLDDRPVPSCLVPAAAVWDCSVVTLEHFAATAIHADIQQGFHQAGAHLCGYCNAGKIFAAYQLIKTRERLERQQILEYLESLSCHCTDNVRVANGILIASNLRRKRESQGGRA